MPARFLLEIDQAKSDHKLIDLVEYQKVSECLHVGMHTLCLHHGVANHSGADA